MSWQRWEPVRQSQKEKWRQQQHEFYVSVVWIDCSRAYRKAHPYCEQCLKNHIITLADDVHHKIKLTPENITDPMVTLNWANLESICDKHHKKEHKKQAGRRWTVEQDGTVTI